jgi:hypothetical protein
MYWYPIEGRKKLYKILKSPWGRLFDNWELLKPDADGFADLGPDKRRMKVSPGHMLEVLRLIGMAIAESPEWQAGKKTGSCFSCLEQQCQQTKCSKKEN